MYATEVLQRLIHAQPDARIPGCRPSLVPNPAGHFAGNPRSAPAGLRTQAQTIATTAELLGSRVLDSSADILATLDRSSGDRQAGDGDCLASCWLPLVLALAITTAWRSTEGQ